MNKKKFIIIILLLSVSLFITKFVSNGYDYYWHITAGKYMINNHTILTKDIFSWYLQGKYWMSHEWLYECFIYIYKIIFKDYHTLIYCSVNSFILLFILFLHNKDNYLKNALFTIIWLFIYVLINIGLFTPRPHLISSWLLALTLYVLYDLRKNSNSNKIYFLPLISLFWANIHGGSSNLSYLLCLFFIITGLFTINNKFIDIKRLSKVQLKKYLIVLILSILVININPHGIKMLIYPYENIMNRLMQQNINEWRPTSIFKLYNYVYFSTILLILVVFIKYKKKIDIVDLLLFIGFSYMGIRSVRFWNYIYIASSFFIFKYIPKRKDDKGTNILLVIISFVLLFISISNIKQYKNKLLNTKVISTTMIDTIKYENPKRLFNLYDYGGYLIYNDIDVFIDGRADLYSKYNYRDYLDISHNINTKGLINKYDFDYYLVNNKYKIYNYLNNNKKYSLVFSINNQYLYKKKDA